MKDLFDGKPYNVTLPSDLPAGSYLMRHEIIALHTATTTGGAEFYPSCSQLQVGGSTTTNAKTLVSGLPSNELATFPGAYKATDPGILVPDVYNTGFDYSKDFPGPAIPSSFAVGGGEDGGSNTTAVPSSAVPTSTMTPTGTASHSHSYASSTPKTSKSATLVLPNEYSSSAAPITVVPTSSSVLVNAGGLSTASVPSVAPVPTATPAHGGKIVVVTMTITLPDEDDSATSTTPIVSATSPIVSAKPTGSPSAYPSRMVSSTVIKASPSLSGDLSSSAEPTPTQAERKRAYVHRSRRAHVAYA